MTRRISLLLALAALLGGSAAAFASRLPLAQQRAYDLAAIPNARSARWTSLGHPTLVANLWWLRAVQYMGDDRADERGYDKLFPAVDLVTELDPRHGYAYQVAGVVLGAVGRASESNAILEKGVRNVPDRYSLPFQRAVNAFLYDGDYPEAGKWFLAASRTPGAPAARMQAYAASMLVKGDRHEQAVALLDEALRTAEDEETRKSLRRQLDQVELEQRAEIVERAAAAYHAHYGFPPVPLQVLVAEGYLAELPADPFGGLLYLDAEGRVRSSKNDYRYQPALTDRDRATHRQQVREHTREMEKSLR
jgi:tetratricopeptide (TPR) repeat protein